MAHERDWTLGSERAAPRVTVVDYEDRHREDFSRLNTEWLERFFSVEPIDRALFAAPRERIIDAGGAIVMGLLDGVVVGTAALVPEGPGEFELAKMAVTERAQGQGVGERIVRECIERARSLGGRWLHLTTNSRLQRAIRLYRRLGFREVALGPAPKYERVDTAMVMKL